MQTLIEINAEEAARRQRAYRYQNATGDKVTAEATIQRQGQQVAHHTAQLQVLDRIEALVAEVDPKIDTGQGLFRYRLQILIAKGRESEQLLLRRAQDAVTQARKRLSAAEAALNEFTE